MSRETKNTILVIIAIILIFVIISIIYQEYKTEPINANESKGNNILEDPNSGLDNMMNKIFDDETENNEEKDKANNEENNENNNENTAKNNESANSQKNNVNSSSEEKENDTENDSTMTPRENKAIDLVKELWKEKWGSLDGVSFNVSIQNDGKYGVTVYNVVTTETIQFYVVDVDTGVVREK